MAGKDLQGVERGDDAQIRTFLIADVRGYTLFTNAQVHPQWGPLLSLVWVR